MHFAALFVTFASSIAVADATICWTNGASLLMGRPLTNPFGLPPQPRNCGLPLQNGGRGPPPSLPPPPQPAQCPPPQTITNTITATVTSTQTQYSTITQTSTTTETQTSTVTQTSTSTVTTTDTSTSYGINPTVVASALSRCQGRNPAYTKPVFDSNGRPACCLPITTTGANSLPTGIC